jgi:hypothetical protein
MPRRGVLWTRLAKRERLFPILEKGQPLIKQYEREASPRSRLSLLRKHGSRYPPQRETPPKVSFEHPVSQTPRPHPVPHTILCVGRTPFCARYQYSL